MADRLARAMDVPQIRVNVFEVAAVNGLATLTGRFTLHAVFWTGARERVTDEELAAVIAHELGHVALGHIRRRMIDTGQNAVVLVAVGAAEPLYCRVWGRS